MASLVCIKCITLPQVSNISSRGVPNSTRTGHSLSQPLAAVEPLARLRRAVGCSLKCINMYERHVSGTGGSDVVVHGCPCCCAGVTMATLVSHNATGQSCCHPPHIAELGLLTLQCWETGVGRRAVCVWVGLGWCAAVPLNHEGSNQLLHTPTRCGDRTAAHLSIGGVTHQQ